MNVPLWSDKYAVGVQKVDEQHRGLFNLLRVLQLESYGDMSTEFLHSKIQEMQFYCYEHFCEEETLMGPYKLVLPMYEDHLLQHADFFTVTQGFAARIDTEGVGLAKDMCEFLGAWLTAHICNMDKATFAAIEILAQGKSLETCEPQEMLQAGKNVRFLQWFHDK